MTRSAVVTGNDDMSIRSVSDFPLFGRFDFNVVNSVNLTKLQLPPKPASRILLKSDRVKDYQIFQDFRTRQKQRGSTVLSHPDGRGLPANPLNRSQLLPTHWTVCAWLDQSDRFSLVTSAPFTLANHVRTNIISISF